MVSRGREEDHSRNNLLNDNARKNCRMFPQVKTVRKRRFTLDLADYLIDQEAFDLNELFGFLMCRMILDSRVRF